MATTLSKANPSRQIDAHQSLLTDAQLFSAPHDGDETEFDGTTDVDRHDKESAIRSTDISGRLRPYSEISTALSSSPSRKHSTSRAYRYVKLERAMLTAQLLKTKDDQKKFENEYYESLQKDTFEQFLQDNYRKIREHYERLKLEEALQQTRAFTFVDLEKNFLDLDPSRHVKIIFKDETPESVISRSGHSRATSSTNPRSISSASSPDAATEAFYAHRSRRLLNDPSRARDEITLFARRSAQRLEERFSRTDTVPHRVLIVDEREKHGPSDERTRLQMKHKRALSVINKRRHIIIKMITQTRRNQIKIEEQWQRTPLSTDQTSCCRELLERAKQIDEDNRSISTILRRPKTGVSSKRTESRTNPSSSIISSPYINPSDDLTPDRSSISTPFQDSLSIHHVEKTDNVRVLRPTRPLTAPIKASWVNYC